MNNLSIHPFRKVYPKNQYPSDTSKPCKTPHGGYIRKMTKKFDARQRYYQVTISKDPVKAAAYTMPGSRRLDKG